MYLKYINNTNVITKIDINTNHTYNKSKITFFIVKKKP